MSKLQDALNYWDRTEHPPMPAVDPFVEAARRVANGTEIRYCAWHESRMFYPDHCQLADDHACAPGDYLLVNAALGITTEGTGIHDWCNPERGLHGSQCTVPETIRMREHQRGITTEDDDNDAN